MRCAVVAGLVLMVMGCDAVDPRPLPSPTPSPTPLAATLSPQELTAAHPSVRFPVNEVTARYVRVQIVSITNPTQQALTLSVALDGIDVGALGVHPPTEPAAYLLSLPPAAVARVTHGNAFLDVRLATQQAADPLRDDVRLTITTAAMTNPP